MKPFERIPNRINVGNRVHLTAEYDGTDLRVQLIIIALDDGGDEVGVENYVIGEETDAEGVTGNDYLGTGGASTFNKLRAVMETIHTKAEVETVPQ